MNVGARVTVRVARVIANAWARLVVAAVLGACLASGAAAQDEIAERLRNRIEAGLSTDAFEVMDERVLARETLRRVYPGRAFRPLWIDARGLTAQGQAFVAWLETGPRRQGLRSEHYHLDAIESLEADRVGALVDLELALSDAFLVVGSHFLAGALNPETLDAEWVANRRHRDLAPVIARIDDGEAPGALLESLLPDDPAYGALVERLAVLRGIRDAGGWPRIEIGPTLRRGDTGPRVAELAARLQASGDYVPGSGAHDSGAHDSGGPDAAGTALPVLDTETFDADLEQGVRRFQARHGLGADGLVGRQSQTALNVPVQDRIDQVIVNLERWRWLPETLGDRYVIVNIAGFRLDVIEHGEPALSMRVVVGRPFRRTPVFSDTIRYLVLNPSWEVPSTIAIQDKLPLIKADPGYIATQGFQLLQGWGADERRVDPATVDWSAVTARNFSYRLRQPPGPMNALGRIKFMFPNKFSVYLHDTPARNLFAEDARAFSSGCIRLESPVDLAALLLGEDPGWSRSAIDAALATGRERNVTLPRPMPVHLLYWTAWADADGRIEFRDDIYGRDVPVLRELREAPPT
jgi:L,D-transpeptidase YcbB